MTVTALPTLQPLSLAELLDRALRLYRQNFLTFVGIIGIVQVPIQLIQVGISIFTFSDTFSQFVPGQRPPSPIEIFTPAYFIGIGASILISFLYILLVYGFATAAITRAIADSYLGQPISILQSYRQIGTVSVKLILSLILASVLAFVIFIWLIIPCVGWLSGPGLLAFFVSGILPMVAPAIVLENQGIAGAIRRGWDLTRRRFWWVVGFIAILFIFGQLIITGPTTLMSFILQAVFGNPAFADSPRAMFTLQTIIQSAVTLTFSLVYVPFQIINHTLMYFDLRVRTEGLDLALQTNTADTPLNAQAFLAQAPQSGGTGIITLREVGYFILLTLIVGVGYILLTTIFGLLGIALMGAAGGFQR